jgi:hypothetical protein
MIFKKILLLLSSACTIYWVISSFTDLYSYYHLTHQTEAQVSQWHILEISSSQYAITGDYSFEYEKSRYSGKTRFRKPYQLNRSSAEEFIRQLQKEQERVYFDPNNPRSSSLEHFFPLKKCLYATISSIITVYFCFLFGIRVLFKKRI